MFWITRYMISGVISTLSSVLPYFDRARVSTPETAVYRNSVHGPKVPRKFLVAVLLVVDEKDQSMNSRSSGYCAARSRRIPHHVGRPEPNLGAARSVGRMSLRYGKYSLTLLRSLLRLVERRVDGIYLLIRNAATWSMNSK